MFLVLFLVQLAFVTVPASVIFEDCGSAYELQAVDIEECGFSLPCYVTLGEEVPVNVQFFADFPSQLLDQNVVININLINLDADVTPDPCVTVDCPVRPNAVNSFTSVMSVPSMMALNQRGYLRWRVYNERKQLVLCYSVLVQTQSPLQKLLRPILAEITPEHANEIVDTLQLESHEPVNEDYLRQLVNQYYATKLQALANTDNTDVK